MEISADDPRFHYEGRIDFSAPTSPVIVWQATRIAIDFTGDSLELRLESKSGQSFFNAVIDGKSTLVELRENHAPRGVSFKKLGAGRHTLRVFKRSEADAGTAVFRGGVLARGSEAFAPPPPAYRVKFQFLGDSITVGACNEDGEIDQWDDRATHNAAKSYAAMTAAAFDADHRNIAISGMGIVTGYVEIKAGEYWDRLYPRANSPRADLESWQPDVVFMNFGENDDSFTRNLLTPFPADEFTREMITLVRKVRGAWPKAHIVILRGGMFGGARSATLRDAWEAAVRVLEADDRAIAHFVFAHWSELHPRVGDHRAMADELIAWLRAQPFLRR